MGSLSTPTGAKLTGTQFGSMLPTELVEILNQAYFLHLLATDPARVLPPGKSLLSMMTRQHTKISSSTTASTSGELKSYNDESVLHDRVEQVVHTAFWNEVRIHADPPKSILNARTRKHRPSNPCHRRSLPSNFFASSASIRTSWKPYPPFFPQTTQ